MHKQLQVVELASNKKWLILPLHSRITREEQNKIFEVPHSTFRKIILATNVAESSITVPDVHYIVDFCLVRQLVVDEQTNFSTLKVKKIFTLIAFLVHSYVFPVLAYLGCKE